MQITNHGGGEYVEAPDYEYPDVERIEGYITQLATTYTDLFIRNVKGFLSTEHSPNPVTMQEHMAELFTDMLSNLIDASREERGIEIRPLRKAAAVKEVL